jgi:exopolysaccharide biosynthesis predicted pyruvyltransferase EpsI
VILLEAGYGTVRAGSLARFGNPRADNTKMLEDIRREMDGLGQELKEKIGDSVSYYNADAGNLGDALIRKGTLSFFKKYNIRIREVRGLRNTPVTELVLSALRRPVWIYGGGGAWIDIYTAKRVVKRSSYISSKVYVLPSTFGTVIKDRRNRYYARDKFESLENCPQATFCHDMAFYADLEPSPITQPEGNFFRLDPESAGAPVPPGNRDISGEGRTYDSLEDFCHGISSCAIVNTDRLHVAIAGALMGREVNLYDNSYFKNRAIYHSSIKDHFPNVHYRGTREGSTKVDA